MKKCFIFFLLSILLVSCCGVFSVSASSSDNPYSYGLEYLDPETYDPGVGFVFLLEYELVKNNLSYQHIVIPLKTVSLSTAATSFRVEDLSFSYDVLSGDTITNIFIEDGTLYDNLGNTRFLGDVEITGIDDNVITCDQFDDPQFYVYFNGTYSGLVDYSDQPFNIPDGYNSSTPIIISLKCTSWNGEIPASPDIDTYVPPYSPGQIESGFQEVVTGLQGIESDLTLETISPDDLGATIGGGHSGGGIYIPEVNATAPLKHFLNNSFVVALLVCVFSFATLSYILFGKKG